MDIVACLSGQWQIQKWGSMEPLEPPLDPPLLELVCEYDTDTPNKDRPENEFRPVYYSCLVFLLDRPRYRIGM